MQFKPSFCISRVNRHKITFTSCHISFHLFSISVLSLSWRVQGCWPTGHGHRARWLINPLHSLGDSNRTQWHRLIQQVQCGPPPHFLPHGTNSPTVADKVGSTTLYPTSLETDLRFWPRYILSFVVVLKLQVMFFLLFFLLSFCFFSSFFS